MSTDPIQSTEPYPGAYGVDTPPDTTTPPPSWRGPLIAALVAAIIIGALAYAPWYTLTFAAGAGCAWCWPPDGDDYLD